VVEEGVCVRQVNASDSLIYNANIRVERVQEGVNMKRIGRERREGGEGGREGPGPRRGGSNKSKGLQRTVAHSTRLYNTSLFSALTLFSMVTQQHMNGHSTTTCSPLSFSILIVQISRFCSPTYSIDTG
jgi:hypothetical protein